MVKGGPLEGPPVFDLKEEWGHGRPWRRGGFQSSPERKGLTRQLRNKLVGDREHQGLQAPLRTDTDTLTSPSGCVSDPWGPRGGALGQGFPFGGGRVREGQEAAWAAPGATGTREGDERLMVVNTVMPDQNLSLSLSHTRTHARTHARTNEHHPKHTVQ